MILLQLTPDNGPRDKTEPASNMIVRRRDYGDDHTRQEGKGIVPAM